MVTGTYRARSGTEIIDAAFQLLKAHYAPLITIAAIGFLPMLILQVLTGGGPGMAQKPLLAAVLGILYLITNVIMQGALVTAVSDVYRGIPIDLQRSVQMGVSKMRTMLVAWLASWILTFIGFCLLIVPGLFFMAWFFVVPVVVMLEDIPALQTISRSKVLCSDHKRRVFAYVGVLFAASIVCGIIFGIVTALTHLSILAVIANVAISVVVWPLYVIFMVLHYYDARIRKEGYDVELLAQAMGTPTTPVAAAT